MYSRLSIYLLRFIKISFLFFILVTNGYAATITVCSSGCNQTTIAAAITSAIAWDTIQISDATHTEWAITINKNLTIEGTNATGTTVQAHASRGSATNSVFIVSANVTATLKNLTIRHGKSTNGGGIQNQNSNAQLTIENCTITANDATRGSGIINGSTSVSNSKLIVINSTISGNGQSSSSSFGGGIYNYADAEISHSTVTGNEAKDTTGYGGGGLLINYAASSTKLNNTIIIGNIAASGKSDCGIGASGSPTYTSQGYNMRSSNTECPFVVATGDIDTITPNLGPLADNGGSTQTHALLTTPTASPAINAGNSCPTFDQRGFGREGTACDIGAYEANPQAETPSVTDATTNEDTQTTSGLVISRNAIDGIEVTHFKITNITNGTLYKNDGTTQINDNNFITFDEGNAGLKFTPALNSTNAGSFTVNASTTSDDTGLSTGSAPATITITPVNDAPIITEGDNTPVTMSANGSPTAFPLTLNATDVDVGDTLTWSILTNATHGEATASGTGNSKAINYTPTINYTGTDSFVVQVSDGTDKDTITVNVTIQAVNTAPTFTSTPPTTGKTSTTYTYTITTNDADGDPLTLTAPTKPAWLTLSGNTLSGTPTSAGTYNVTLQVSDGTAITTQTFTITVTQKDTTVVIPPPPPPEKVQLHVSTGGDGNGQATPSPIPSDAMTECSTQKNCTYTYDRNTTVTLIAAPDQHSKFQNWSDSCRNGEASLYKDRTYCIAYFVLKTYQLTVNTSGSGQGTVFVNPASHSCGDNCTRHTSGTQVTLTATPANNSTFNGWQGNCDANGQVTIVNGDKSCTAVFEILPTYQLTTTIVGNGSITSNPAGIDCGTTCTAGFYAGTPVTLTPSAAEGYTFQNWSDNCPNGQIILNNNQQCTATFLAIETPPPVVETTNTLTVIVSGNGTVSRDGQGTPDCGDNCERYLTGTTVSLTPTAGDDSYFGRWIGDGCGEPIVLNADKHCEAVFTKIPTYPLNFGQSGTGRGDLTFSPEGEKCGMQCVSYQIGTEVTLTTSPVEGAIFTGWQGDADCADGKITMDSQKRCIATFGFADTVQFSSLQYVVSEDTESMTIVVNRLGDSVGQISVDYSTLDNTAGEGDYTPTNGTLTWADGDATPKAFEVFVHIDKETEPEESVKLILANPQGGATLGALATAELLITDAPWFSSIQFAQPTYTTNEIAGFANLLVTRAGGQQGEVTVDYAISGGTAIAEQDYTPISGTLVWADGDRTHRTIGLPVLTDSLVDGDKTITLTLSNLTGDAEIGSNSQATVLITDTPPPGSVQFSAAEYQADESMTTVKIAVERLGGSAGEMTVNYATQEGTAKVEQDYMARQGTLKWYDGDAEPKIIVIPVITDNQLESTEYLTLTLNQPTGGANLGAITTATLHITDRPEAENSPGVISFSQADYEISESAGSITLIAQRTGGSQGALQVVYTLQDGTAKAGQDYTATQGGLHWEDGEQGEKYFSIGILDDLAVEETEQFSVLLTQADNPVTTQVIVQDDDKTLVQFSQESYLVPINQNTVAVTVQRIGSRVGQVTVNYMTEDGSAQAGLDYQPTQGTLTWSNGEMAEKTIVIPLSYQATAVNKTLYLVLSNVSGNAQLGEITETAITLANDDLSGCQLPLLADGSLKVDSPLIDCVLINDQTLTNARITPRGAVMGGKLAGKTQNAGLIQNVTLLEGATLTGGRLEGLIVGEIPIEAYLQADLNSEKIPQLATINAVTIPAHTTLDRVVIGKNSIMDIRAKLSQEVRFESNETIPYNLDLADMLNWTRPTVLNQTAILLTDDVLLYSAEGGILTAMNGLPMLRNDSFVLTQNPNNGYIILDVDSTRYAVLPVRVRHILSQQVKKQIPLGLERLDDGQMVFITHTGREITTVPIVQSPDALRKALAKLNLHEISAQTDGTLHVPAENGFYSARPDLLATIVSEPLLDGIYTQESEVFLVFTDEQGKQRQQFLYPAPAKADALRALDATAVLNLDGSVFLQIGTQSYKGTLDYWVSTVDKPRETAQIVQITDVNGDGSLDYQINYPDGGQQVLFQF